MGDNPGGKIAQATITLKPEELEVLLFIRRARNAAGKATLRIELEITKEEIRPTNVIKLNPDPVLALS